MITTIWGVKYWQAKAKIRKIWVWCLLLKVLKSGGFIIGTLLCKALLQKGHCSSKNGITSTSDGNIRVWVCPAPDALQMPFFSETLEEKDLEKTVTNIPRKSSCSTHCFFTELILLYTTGSGSRVLPVFCVWEWQWKSFGSMIYHYFLETEVYHSTRDRATRKHPNHMGF